MNITSKISKIVNSACAKRTNYFGYGSWSHHIVSVVKYGKLLAKKLHADREVVELAALLHDYASVSNIKLYPKHHLYGSRLAKDLLSKYHYPPLRIKKIQHCIETHRASRRLKPKTLEAKIVANADHLAHFDNVNSLLYLAYKNHGLGIDEGTAWVLNKLEKGWKKLTLPAARKIILPKYRSIKMTLKNI